MKKLLHNSKLTIVIIILAVVLPNKLLAQNELKENVSLASSTGLYAYAGTSYYSRSYDVTNRIYHPTTKTDALLAIKTNLLFDLATMLNVELEVPIGSRWSINGEYLFPWWVDKQGNSFALQLIAGNVEGRYWLGERRHKRVLTGHFVGAYLGGGYYDLQLSRGSGYQGEFFIASGASYGYVMPIINDNFSLEFSVGIGYLRTKYRHYNVEERGAVLARDYSGNRSWLGPTKLKVSFSWMLFRKAKSHIR